MEDTRSGDEGRLASDKDTEPQPMGDPFPADLVRSLHARNSVSTEVYHGIRDGIISGRVAPGQWLRQETLAQQLGVSQTPVRQALERLVAEGFAERLPQRGVRVTRFRPSELLDTAVFRVFLEGPVARLAAVNRSADDLQALVQLVDNERRMLSTDLTSLDTIAERRRMNEKFHLLVGSFTGSLILSQLYGTVVSLVPVWGLGERDLTTVPERARDDLTNEVREHGAILQAISDRDLYAAEKVAMKHVMAMTGGIVRDLGLSWDEFLARQIELSPTREFIETIARDS